MALKCDGKAHKIDTLRLWGQGIGLEAAIADSKADALAQAFKWAEAHHCPPPCDPTPWVKVKPAQHPAQPDSDIPAHPQPGHRVFVLRSWDIWATCTPDDHELPKG